MTEAERLLWRALRDRQLAGFKFRRQHPVRPYVVDFVCIERKLVVEIDGGQHAQQVAKDAVRTTVIQAKGYRVIRFWNNEVLENLEGVLQSILAALNE